MYMCIYRYIYIYIHSYIYTYIHIYHKHTYTYIHTNTTYTTYMIADLTVWRLAYGIRTYGVATVNRLLKIEVSSAKEPYIRDYILQKRPIILRSLLIVATP